MMKSVSPAHAFNSFLHPHPVATPIDLHFLRDPSNASVCLQELENFDWASNEKNALEFLDCIVNLVSFNGCYIPSCFQLLVQGFIPKQKDADYDLELSDKISHLIHSTLQKIVTLAPLSTPLLGIALEKQFPHKRHSSEVMFAYLKNLLLVSYYAPSIINAVMCTAVDRLIKIDVDIKLDDVQEEADDLQFEVEIEDAKEPTEAEMTARKLDSMMIVMFEYLDAAFGACSSEEHEHTFPPMNLNQTHREQLFDILLQIFDKYILTTYKSKYTQFLLFYVCRLKPQENNSFSAKFMAYLFNIIQQKIYNNTNQLASSAYLGSFLSRASYVPASTLREVVTFMLNWTLSYLKTRPNASPDAVVHGLFYSMSQSLYYIFCFHYKTLLSEGDVEILKRGYQRITESKFNPLKFCLPTIVREFVRICLETEWFDYSDLLKENEKLVLATKSSFGGSNQLEIFFPFDPYLLKHSSKYITDYYVKWTAPDDEDTAPAPADDASDSSDDDDDDDADGDDNDDDNNDGDNDNDRQSSDDMDELTQDFMHFTPDVEKELTYRFSSS
jgi:RNA polymerase I-specific transcription initiation factor RRN3